MPQEPVRTTSVKSPRNASVKGAPNFSGRGVDEVWKKFEMSIVQQILTAGRNFPTGSQLPCEMSIDGGVAGDIEAWEPIDISNHKIVLEMLSEID